MLKYVLERTFTQSSMLKQKNAYIIDINLGELGIKRYYSAFDIQYFCGDKLNSNWLLEISLHTRTRLNENGSLFQLTPAIVGLLDWLVYFPQPASQQANVAKLLYVQMNIEPDWLIYLN